jgi:hypothetical protein
LPRVPISRDQSWRSRYRNRCRGIEIAERKSRLANAKRGQNDDPEEHKKLLGLVPIDWVASNPEGQSYIRIYTTGALDERFNETLATISAFIIEKFEEPALRFGTIDGLEFKKLEALYSYSPKGHFDVHISNDKKKFEKFNFACIISKISDDNDVIRGQNIVDIFSTMIIAIFGPSIAYNLIFDGFLKHQKGKLVYREVTLGPFPGAENIFLPNDALVTLHNAWAAAQGTDDNSDRVRRALTMLSIAQEDTNFCRFSSLCWTALEIILGQRNTLNKLKAFYKKSPHYQLFKSLDMNGFYKIRNGFVHHGELNNSEDTLEVRSYMMLIVIDCIEDLSNLRKRYLAIEFALMRSDKLIKFGVVLNI